MLTADALADTTVALAIVTAVAATATVALAKITHDGIASERADASKQIEVARETAAAEIRAMRETTAEQVAAARDQLDAAHRPLLIEVSPTGAIHPDMGARQAPGTGRGDPDAVLPETIELKFDGRESEEVDPRQVIVRVERGMAFVSVPLRNVGRGLAIIDDGISIRGVTLGALKAPPTVDRPRVPVGESLRIKITAQHAIGAGPRMTSNDRWVLEVPYTDFASRQQATAHVEIGFRGVDFENPIWMVTAVTHRG